MTVCDVKLQSALDIIMRVKKTRGNKKKKKNQIKKHRRYFIKDEFFELDYY